MNNRRGEHCSSVFKGAITVDIIKYEVGETIELKKVHPCGSNTWEVLRNGVDYRLKCTGCGHIILLPRIKLGKMVKTKK